MAEIMCVLTKGALEMMMLDYGKAVIKTAIAVNILKDRDPFNLLTEDQEALTIPHIKQCQELGIVRSKATPEELAYNGLILFNGIVLMWAMGQLGDVDIYQKILEANQVLFDVDPKFFFPADLI